MNVRMPDGVLVRDVPEGTTQEELQARYAASKPPLELPSKTIQREAANQYLGGTAADKGQWAQAWGGIRHAGERAAYGLKGLVTDLTPDDREQLARGEAFVKETGPSSTIGEWGAEGATALLPGGLVRQGGRVLARAIPGALGTLARAAGVTAGDAATGAALSPENRSGGAIGGAAGSVLGHGVQRAAGGLVAPWVKPEARELMDRTGIVPTVGQAVGGGFNTVEQQATSLPFVGNAVRNARNRAVNEFNVAVTNRARPPGRTAPLPDRGVGDRAVISVGDEISDHYNNALDMFPPNFTVDHAAISQAAQEAASRPDLVLSRDGQQRVLDAVRNTILNRSPNLTPEVAKRIQSDLRAGVRSQLSSSSAEDRAVGAALNDVQSAWTQSMAGIGDSTGTGAGHMLREADAAYHAFLPIDRAASSAIAQNAAVTTEAGRFTPRLLRRSIEAVDQSKNNRASRRVAAGMDPYERPQAPAAAAADAEPIITREPRTPMSSSTELATSPDFGYGSPRTALPPPGGQLGPVRGSDLGPVRGGRDLGPVGDAGGGELGPVSTAAGEAPRAGYAPDTRLHNAPDAAGPSAHDEINRISRLAESVTPDYVADSGSAGRALGIAGWGSAVTGGGLMGGLLGALAAPAVWGAATLGGSRAGQRFLLEGGPEWMQQGARRYLTPGLVGAGIDAGADPSMSIEDQMKLARQLRERR